MTGMSVLFLALAIDVAIADDYPQFSAPRQFCGSKLADQLRILCKTKYNERGGPTPRPRKRAGRPNAHDRDFDDLYYDYNTIDSPFGGPNSETAGYEPSGFLRSPNKRKITDECCAKPCSVDELKSYCGSG